MKISDLISRRFNKPENKGDEFGFTNQYNANSKRIVNKDGSFNVIRIGEKQSLFHMLVMMTWTKFAGVVLLFYLLLNTLFAWLYELVDINGIGMTADYHVHSKFLISFFFSAQTLTTVGYGSLYPLTAPASALAAIEALIGLMSFAIFTGLMYGRFSKPLGGIRFSKNILVAPHKEGQALIFRVANERDHNLTEMEARVLMSVVVNDQGKESRKYQAIELENSKVNYFPINWTLVHYINEQSPLYGLSKEEFIASEFEWLVMIKGYNLTATQQIHVKSSYTTNEMIWNARFTLPYHFNENGITVFELNKIDDFEMLPD